MGKTPRRCNGVTVFWLCARNPSRHIAQSGHLLHVPGRCMDRQSKGDRKQQASGGPGRHDAWDRHACGCGLARELDVGRGLGVIFRTRSLQRDRQKLSGPGINVNPGILHKLVLCCAARILVIHNQHHRLLRPALRRLRSKASNKTGRPGSIVHVV